MPIRLHESLSPRGAQAALGVLAAAERHAAAELVDEGERQRLHELRAAGSGPASTPEAFAAAHPTWRPLIADLDGQHAGYAGLLLPEGDATKAVAELVVVPALRRRGVGSLLLREMEDQARAAGAASLSVWARDDDASRSFAEVHGCKVDRHLDGLGRKRQPVAAPVPPSGVELRPYRPGPDDQGVVETLAVAFADNPDRSWDLERLAERRRRPWFDDAGVIVAVRGDDVVGVHITKDRGDGVGEVHILAVHPKAHGGGLGRALLRAGLEHLQEEVGVDDVILWMEHDNHAARALYESEDFVQRWSDISYARDLG